MPAFLISFTLSWTALHGFYNSGEASVGKLPLVTAGLMGGGGRAPSVQFPFQPARRCARVWAACHPHGAHVALSLSRHPAGLEPGLPQEGQPSRTRTACADRAALPHCGGSGRIPSEERN